MKLNFFNILWLFISFGSIGQSFIGLNTDNFSGIHGVLSNPANVVGSRTKIDINLLGVSGYLSNDYASVNFLNLINKGGIDFNDDENLNPNNNNSTFNLDILGPSFMFNINEKKAIAITTRARVFSNINKLPGNTIKLFDSGVNGSNPIRINDFSASSTLHAWTEYGITYGYVFANTAKHFVKAGFTAKYLNGYGYVNVEAQKVSLDYDPNAPNADGAASGRLAVDGTISYTFSENLDLNKDNRIFRDNRDYEIKSETTGFGLDVGIVYEYRKEEEDTSLKDENKYFLKAGISFTNLGTLQYKNAPIVNYTLAGAELSQQTLNNPTFKGVENKLRKARTSGSRDIGLPAAMHVNLDWNTNNKLYVNLNADISLRRKNSDVTNTIENSLLVTPRFETELFSVFLPIGFRQFSGFNWGAGFRFGQLYAGSGSIISNLISKKSKSIDIYAGLKISIFKPKKEIKEEGNNDLDGDGVIDKLDNCPGIFGLTSNGGCPESFVTDMDGDSVEDAFDECPEVFGSVENRGCPELGYIALDSEKAKEIEEKLNVNNKINFESASSKFTPETYIDLKTIQKILKIYANLNFDINGFADSTGTKEKNQILSEKRAKAVKVYLVYKGVKAARLNVKGFGESNPISTNKTPEGRKINRRVEIRIAE